MSVYEKKLERVAKFSEILRSLERLENNAFYDNEKCRICPDRGLFVKALKEKIKQLSDEEANTQELSQLWIGGVETDVQREQDGNNRILMNMPDPLKVLDENLKKIAPSEKNGFYREQRKAAKGHSKALKEAARHCTPGKGVKVLFEDKPRPESKRTKK